MSSKIVITLPKSYNVTHFVTNVTHILFNDIRGIKFPSIQVRCDWLIAKVISIQRIKNA